MKIWRVFGGKEEGSVSGMRKGMHGHLVQALQTEA